MSSATYPVYLSLGSNMKDRKGNLTAALGDLRNIATVTKVSSLYETEPVGNILQSDFFNMAIRLETEQDPVDFMNELLAIELRMGRQRIQPQGPRVIDIDIIFYDHVIIQTPDLSIPHPRYADRNFVLAPLAEIAPDYRCPIRGMTLQELFDVSSDRHKVRKISTMPTAAAAID